MYFFLQINEITRFFSCLCIFIQQIFSFFYKKAENVFVYMFLKKLGFFKKKSFFRTFFHTAVDSVIVLCYGYVRIHYSLKERRL